MSIVWPPIAVSLLLMTLHSEIQNAFNGDLNMTNVNKTPHIHVKVIKEWADGKQIQYWSNMCEEWFDCPENNPPWHPKAKYRVKPEPKPDVVKYMYIGENRANWPSHFTNYLDNVVLVYDGETGKLKDVQLLAKE
jgi:hypothetical protein